MSHSSYTASERRGIILIAVVSLILVGVGFGFTLCDRHPSRDEAYPIVEQHDELIDSTAAPASKKEKDSKKSKKRKARESSAKPSSKKTYRRRSPRDEPVSVIRNTDFHL